MKSIQDEDYDNNAPSSDYKLNQLGDQERRLTNNESEKSLVEHNGDVY